MKKIVVFGATGMLGRIVTKALIQAGFDVTVMVRNEQAAARLFPDATIVKGDLKKAEDVEKAIAGQDGVYMSLSVLQTEGQSDWHSEQQGIDNIIAAAIKEGVQRIAYLSSLVQLYQGMNDFDWWVFRIKQEAVQKIKGAGIPYTIFYPTAFMESIAYQSRQLNFIALGGKSEYSLHYIAAHDFGQQVVTSFKFLQNENREYVVQGTEGFTQDEAARVFIRHYTKEKLRTLWAPMFMMKMMGLFSKKLDYGYHIVTALNKYPERFEATETWAELGKPRIRLKEFASTL